jgi:predicted dehydrogenase
MMEKPAETNPGPTVRWGIVGTGMIAGHFAGDMRHAEGGTLAAVCSRSMATARQFADGHGSPQPFDDLAAMIESDAVDAIYLATPNTAHFKDALTVLGARKPLLIEKPLTATSAEAERLASEARAQGVFLMEAMWTRFLPAVRKAKTLVEDGAIGRVRRIRAELFYPRDFDPGSRFFSPDLGGGAMLDLGVYTISLALFFMGRPTGVGGSWRAAPNGVDLGADIKLAFGDINAELSCGFDRNGANQFVIEGETGRLVLDSHFVQARGFLLVRQEAWSPLIEMKGSSLPARAFRKLTRKVPLPGVSRHAADFPGYGLQFETEAANAAIRAGKQEHSISPLAETIETLRIIETVRAQRPV